MGIFQDNTSPKSLQWLRAAETGSRGNRDFRRALTVAIQNCSIHCIVAMAGSRPKFARGLTIVIKLGGRDCIYVAPVSMTRVYACRHFVYRSRDNASAIAFYSVIDCRDCCAPSEQRTQSRLGVVWSYWCWSETHGNARTSKKFGQEAGRSIDFVGSICHYNIRYYGPT